MSLKLPNLCVVDGKLHVPADYLAAHPNFILILDLKPRLITAHPFSNQKTLTIARDPIVYCVRYVDNEWVTDHFPSMYIDHRCLSKNAVTEREVANPRLPDEKYLGITVYKAAFLVDLWKLNFDAFLDKEEFSQAVGAV